ncbi:putative ABC transport system permease protein [Acetitomaculum ruminis DSM 5522]|uniref:Putative ABC transport system permease protein n=1 Tax=Acetitomaculum ruminis DSM 5522 TaxID=1120918 RepID=A0A1I0W6I1_9FIRM|nr:ABC transporter permease [Acetitomaculum ruminis]SFA83937.1 putative ABC transport system permease protein [Acetitomaculum ruminis DSM 5522]
MKNPLNKRILREIKEDIGKYLVIFILLVASIAFVSGFLVADGSMVKAYDESFEKYNIEDGNFTSKNKINRAQKKNIEVFGLTLYDNFFAEVKLNNNDTLRIFKNRKEIDKVCLMKGEFPKKADEIAIDRMFADNNNLKVGDEIWDSHHKWKITGLVSLSDYSCLFSDNNDTMFDSLAFGVAVVSEEGFDFKEEELNYRYSFIYNEKPKDETEEYNRSKDLIEVLNNEIALKDFIPRYANQAIIYAGEDMSGDKQAIVVFLYIIIVIIAFVFGVTGANTIVKESAVIGTLRAMGYEKKELIKHYLMPPLIVTLISAITGNILGYSLMKDYCAGMYYGSYSLTTFVTIWNGEAFVMTTVIPFIIMLLINYLVLSNKLSLKPLNFIRRDLRKNKKKKTMKLSHKLPVFTRFRIRVIIQNLSNYLVLFVGIFFANMILVYGLIFPSLINHYQSNVKENMLCNYQYILEVPSDVFDKNHKLESMVNLLMYFNEVETENEDAEKFTAYSLKTIPGKLSSVEENVAIYGVKDKSRYINIDFKENDVYITKAYADKYLLKTGDTIQLKEAYKNNKYDFKITGIINDEATLSIYMPIKDANKMFDLGDSYFSGYFSDTKITDIDEEYIGSVIDITALTKISRQLDKSMGSIMNLLNYFAMLIFFVLVYLLSKVIIEKNAQSISMVKILGFRDLEVSRLYILATSIMVVLFIIITIPVEIWLVKIIVEVILRTSISGWIAFYLDPFLPLEMFALGVATYAIVVIFEYIKIRKVPKDIALKNVE